MEILGGGFVIPSPAVTYIPTTPTVVVLWYTFPFNLYFEVYIENLDRIRFGLIPSFLSVQYGFKAASSPLSLKRMGKLFHMRVSTTKIPQILIENLDRSGY